MPETLLLGFCAFGASLLTFFCGFGLGTLLLPVFACFMPLDRAVAATAVVHFVNGLFKWVLVGRFADRRVVLVFGIPAIVAAMVGAEVLSRLPDQGRLFEWTLGTHTFGPTAARGLVGLLLGVMVVLESGTAFDRIRTGGTRTLVIGGLLSGFFGGVSGMQGALRSAFLSKQGLSKEAFVATGAVIAACVDVSRLGIYASDWRRHADDIRWVPVFVAVVGALIGARVGATYLRKVEGAMVSRCVGAALLVMSAAMMVGLV